MAPIVIEVRKMRLEIAVKSEEEWKMFDWWCPCEKERAPSRPHVPCTWGHHRFSISLPFPY
jgi:hypothetical protein